MNEYLRKWCCLIIFNPKPTDFPSLIQLASLDCTSWFYLGDTNYESLNIDPEKKFLLQGSDIGKLMQEAFASAFSKGFRKVVLIKNNFDQVQSHQIPEAFNALKMIEFCIGPKENGDYYLIGMNYFEPMIFTNRNWESTLLLKETIKDIGKLKQALYKLKTLQTSDYARTLHS